MKSSALFALFAIGIALSIGCQTGGRSESRLFATEQAGFMIIQHPDSTQPEIRYRLRLSANRSIEQPMILRVTYENPQNPNLPLVQQERVEERSISITLESQSIWGLRMGETYQVLIEAFDTTGNRLGTHRQSVYSTIDTSLPNLGRG